MMQGNFRRAVEAYGNTGRSRSHRGVTGHFVIFPRTGAHTSRENRAERDRNSTGEADLTLSLLKTLNAVEIQDFLAFGVLSRDRQAAQQRRRDRKRQETE